MLRGTNGEGWRTNLLINKKTTLSIRAFEPGGRGLDKIAWSNFERAKHGPKGGGQDARSNPSGRAKFFNDSA